MQVLMDNYCFACGKDNPIGLRLGDFRFEGHDLVVDFTPRQEHQGWHDVMHGGLVSVLLDEIMTWRVVRGRGDAVTAELAVRLRAPLPVGTPVRARGRITGGRGRLVCTEAEIVGTDGTLYATASGKFMLVGRGETGQAARDA